MDEGENAHKRETNHCVYWNPGRFVRKTEPWQRIHPRGAHSLGQLGTACFISTSFFYTSRNSLHIWNLEGNISKAKKAFFSSWGLSELFVRSLPGSLVDNHVSWYFYVQKDFGIRSWPLTFCVSWAFLSAWHRFCNVFVLVIFFFKKNQNLSYYPPKCH